MKYTCTEDVVLNGMVVIKKGETDWELNSQGDGVTLLTKDKELIGVADETFAHCFVGIGEKLVWKPAYSKQLTGTAFRCIKDLPTIIKPVKNETPGISFVIAQKDSNWFVSDEKPTGGVAKDHILLSDGHKVIAVSPAELEEYFTEPPKERKPFSGPLTVSITKDKMLTQIPGFYDVMKDTIEKVAIEKVQAEEAKLSEQGVNPGSAVFGLFECKENYIVEGYVVAKKGSLWLLNNQINTTNDVVLSNGRIDLSLNNPIVEKHFKPTEPHKWKSMYTEFENVCLGVPYTGEEHDEEKMGDK